MLTKKEWALRFFIYAVGLMTLAVGVTFSTKAGLGISPITAVPYSVANAFPVIPFSVSVFLVYAVMLILQFAIKGKRREWRDLLQIPFSFVFSAFLEWFGTLFDLGFETLWQNLILLTLATVCIGVGAAIMVAMHMVPNPPDGVIYAVHMVTGRDMGLLKNLLDLLCVAIAAAVDLVFTGRLSSVGLGTVVVMVLTGRVVYAFNRLFRRRLRRLAGLEQ